MSSSDSIQVSDDEGHLQVLTSSICINEESLYKIHVFQIAHIGL